MDIPDIIFQARALQLSLNEMSKPENKGIYYLSFADEERFLGGVFTEAYGIVTAIENTHELGINPGGEVMCIGPGPAPRPEYLNRLLTKGELEEAAP